jgi:hypothetical protein
MYKKIIIAVIVILFLGFITFNVVTRCIDSKNLFYGLSPKAIYHNYKIYDLVEQKKLMCAEAIEILDSDNDYIYYFNCLKSGQIYLVKGINKIKVKEAYNKGIISKEDLYELGIIDRMSR